MVFTYQQLYEAWKSAVTQSSEEPNRCKFKFYLEDNLLTLQNEIDDRTFQPSPFKEKIIYYPKRRVAQVPSIRDKVIQHAMYDNGLYDMLSVPLIAGVSACVRERGDSYASTHLKNILRSYYLKHGKHFYCLKCDIKSYFASIKHDRVYQLMERYVTNDDYKWIMTQFIEQSETGLALGLTQSQALANLYLSELDHMCKEKLGAKYYGRHMDDFYIISDNYDYLVRCWEAIEKYVHSIGLSLNQKTCIYTNKIEFLGFCYFMTDSGKIVKRLLKDKRITKRRELKKKLRAVQAGELSAEAFAQSYNGWRAHTLQGDCHALVSKWDRWITKELWRLGYKIVIHKRSVRVYDVKNDT